MIKILIYEASHHKDPFTKRALAEYSKRLSRIASIRYKKLDNAPNGAIYFCSGGTPLTSPQLAKRFAAQLQVGNELHLVLDSPKSDVSETIQLVSLPLMGGTESVLLLEQVYRTFKINHGEPYHK